MLALVVAGWAPGSARADGATVLGYRAAEAPAGAGEVADAVRAALEQRGAAVVDDGFAAARARLDAGAIPIAWLRDFRRARELADEGWRAYYAVNRSFAVSRLSAARSSAERVLAIGGGTRLFAEISLRLGVVVRDLGRGEQARDLFRLAHVLDPAREVTLAEFAPDVVEAFAAARDPRAGQIQVALAIRSGGGEVSIDGGPYRRAPLSVALAPGQHVVAARGVGFRARGQVFEVDAGATPVQVVVDLEPEPLAAAVARGPASLAVGTAERDAALAVEGVLRYGELDELVLVASVWRRGKPALLGQVCAGVPVRCGAVAEVGYGEVGQLAAAARELAGTLGERGAARRFPPTLLVDRRLVSGERAPGTGGGTVRSRWWRSPYLWVGLGVVALGTSAALIFRRDQNLEPVIVGDPCDFVTCP